jgi:hypothetical protein
VYTPCTASFLESEPRRRGRTQREMQKEKKVEEEVAALVIQEA